MPSFPNIDDAEAGCADRIPAHGAPRGKNIPNPIAGLESPLLPAAAGPAADQAGAAVYQDHCAICHGDHMEGNPPSIPMLAGLGKRFTAAQTVEALQKGKGAMPPMTDVQGPELEALLRYLGVETQAIGRGAGSRAGRSTFSRGITSFSIRTDIRRLRRRGAR